MRFDIFTLFPGFFVSPLESSILGRAQKNRVLEVGVHDIRAWTDDKHHVCDDVPYGGGAGMVMKAEPVARAVEDVLKWDAVSQAGQPPCPVILMSPQGRPFSQEIARELSGHSRIAILCGHYEGIDERAIAMLVTDEISVGDYVLTGGEVASLIVMDAVARLIPGVLGNEQSAQSDSFQDGLLEAPHYTRPQEWRSLKVPDVLLSGHHAEIEKWRRRQGLRRTFARRRDLVEKIEYSNWSKTDLETLAQLKREEIEETKRDQSAGGNDEPEFD
jgi:tRNA (guanine37-N1)-methyltransferase